MAEEIKKEKQEGFLKSYENKTFTFYASVEKSDRDNDIVFIDGIDMTNYMKNPVFLSFHEARSVPIGKVVNYRKTLLENVKALEIDVEFAETETGQEFKYLYENGFLSAVSIRFDSLKHAVNNERKGYDYLESELYEVSAVTIPANQYALMKKSYENKINNDKKLEVFVENKVKEFYEKLSGAECAERNEKLDNFVKAKIISIAKNIK